MGRRKIDITMVTNRMSRQITFSKRRNGLFRKASELATLCGVQIAIIAFSPGGKPFSFAHPSVESIAQRFEDEGNESAPFRSQHDATLENLNKELCDLQKECKAEEKKGKEIEKALKEKGLDHIDDFVEDMGPEELQNLKELLENIREDVKVQSEELEVCSSLLELAKKPAT